TMPYVEHLIARCGIGDHAPRDEMLDVGHRPVLERHVGRGLLGGKDARQQDHRKNQQCTLESRVNSRLGPTAEAASRTSSPLSAWRRGGQGVRTGRAEPRLQPRTLDGYDVWVAHRGLRYR